MNTIYSTLALLVSLATSVQAQDTSHQSNAGIKEGNLAAVRFDGSEKRAAGFHIGVYVHW
jgi:hypothetical protein